MDSEDRPITDKELQRELRSFRNEVRILILGALLASQIFDHADAQAWVEGTVIGVPLVMATIAAAVHWFKYW